jgi:hypothetical protein
VVKNLLLLLLCVPLIYVGLAEGHRLYGPPQSAPAATPADLSSADIALRTAHARGADIDVLRPEVRASVLRLDDELPKGTEERSPFTDLVRALKAQSDNYWDVRLFMRQYGSLTADESVTSAEFRGNSKEQFQNWMKSRRALLQLEREMENLAADLPSKAESLRKRVDEYRVKPFHNEGRANGYLAKIERIDLERKRDDIARDYERGLTGDRNTRGRVRGEIIDYLKKVRGYAENDRYRDVNEEDRWARKQQTEWEARLKLLDLSDPAASAMSDAKFAEQIKALAVLQADMELPGDFRRMLRETATRCCEAYLPNQISKDVNVLAGGKTVPRSKISVTWLSGTTETLTKAGCDETDIQLSKVNQFYDSENNCTVEASDLKPTKKSLAAKAYNDSRKSLRRWDAASVKQLHDDCAKFKGDLEVWGKVEELQKMVKAYPDLFGEA